MNMKWPFARVLNVPSSILRVARCAVCALAAIVALQFQPDARAETYPSRPIRIVVGFGPGGQADILARYLAQKLTAQLKQAVIVENRAGAAGNIGTELVAKSPADGYTLLLIASSFAVNPSLFKRVNYDPVKDFAPVTPLITYPLYLVGRSSGPRNVKDLIAAAKAQPGHINYASSGQGTSTHIAAELFASAGVKLTQVPYKGGGQSTMSVSAGETDILFGGNAVVPLVQGGRLHLLAVTSEKRLPDFPNVPTVAESLPGFVFSSWNGVFAPAGTPPAIIKLLNAEISKAMRHPDGVEALKKVDAQLALGTPEELGTLVKSEYAKWTRVIQDLGITAE